MHDAVGTRFVGEEIVHGPGTTPHFVEGPLQDIGRPDGLPEFFV